MARVRLEGLSKVHDDGHVAVHDLTLDVAEGEFLVLVGPSGCGKSTTLRMVAGLDTATSGQVLIGDRDVTGAAPAERDVAMVFQSFALYPHMTVADNMGFALKVGKVDKPEIERRVGEAAALLGLESLLAKKPKQLSGGEQQRVAMGRAVVRQPKVFLMDEPLSNLDARLRAEMRAELARLQRRLHVTTIYVTHDQVEAMTMGDRVAVMDRGVLQQVASPRELYARPANAFVAQFLGSPGMNLRSGSDGLLTGVRPEHLAIGSPVGGHDEVWGEGEVHLVEHLGAETLAHVRTGPPGDESTNTVVRCGADAPPVVGARVTLTCDPAQVHRFHADSGLRLD